MPSKIGVTIALPCGKWQNHVVPATAATAALCRAIGGALRDEGSYSWAIVGVVPSLEPSHATIRSVPIVSDDGGAEGQRFSILRDEVAPKTVAMYGPSPTANTGVAANGVPLSGVGNSSIGQMKSSALLTEQQCRAFQRECLPATVLLPERLPPGADGRVMVAREARMAALGLTALPEYPTTPNAPRPSCLELTIVVLEDVTTGEDFLAGDVAPPPPAVATSYDFTPLTGSAFPRSGGADRETPTLPMVAPLSFLTSDTSTRDVLPVSFDRTDDKISADDDGQQSHSVPHSGRIRHSRRLSSTSQLSLSSAPETKQHGGAENETIRISPDLAGDVVSGDSTPTAHAHPQNGGLLAKSSGGTGGGLARGRSRSQRRVQLMSPGSDPNHRRRATISTSPRSSGGGTPGLLNLPANNGGVVGHSRLLEPLGDVFSNSASPATSSAASPAPNAALVPLCLPHHAVSPLDARELSGGGSTTASDRPNFHGSSTSPGRAGSSTASGIASSPAAVSPSMGRRSVGGIGGIGAAGAAQQQRRKSSKASRLAPLSTTGNSNSIGKNGASSPPRVSPQHSRTASGAASSAPSMSPSASRRSSLAGTPKASNQATPKNAQRSRSRRLSRSDSRTGSSTTAPQGDARKSTSTATEPQTVVVGGGCAPITDDEAQSPVNSGRKLQRRASRRLSRSGSRRASSALSLSTGTEAHMTGTEIVGSTTGAVPAAAMSSEIKAGAVVVGGGDQALDSSTLAFASDSATALPTTVRQVSVTVCVKASIDAFGESPCVHATKTTSVVLDANAEVVDLCRRVGCAISSRQDEDQSGGSWPVGSALVLQGSPLCATKKTTTPKSAGGSLPLAGVFDSGVFGRTVDDRDPATDHHPVSNAPSPYHRQTQNQIRKNPNLNPTGARRPSVPYAMFEAGMSSGDLKEVFYPSEEEVEKRRLRAAKSEADARVRDRRVFSALDLRYATSPTSRALKTSAGHIQTHVERITEKGKRVEASTSSVLLSPADIRQFQHECMPDTDALMAALKAEVEALRGYHSPSVTTSLSPLSVQQALTLNAEAAGSESAKHSVNGSRTSKRQRDGGTGEGGPAEDPFATSLKQRSTIPVRSLPPLKRPSELPTEHCSPLHSLTAGGEAGARGGDHAPAHGRPQFDPSALYSSPKSHPAPSGPGAPPPVSPAARRLLEAQRFSFSSPSGPSAEHRAEQSHFKTQRQEESESPSNVTEPSVCFTVDVTSITDVVSGEELLAAPQ